MMKLDLSNVPTGDPYISKKDTIQMWYSENFHEYIFNDELNIYVHPETGDCVRGLIEWDKNGNKYYRQGSAIKRHNNGRGYMVANIGHGGKYRSITQHRTIYSTLNKLPYDGDYTVGHLDDVSTNNLPSNLYGIYGTKQHKQNIEHKQKAYKLLELYTRGDLYDSQGNKIQI